MQYNDLETIFQIIGGLSVLLYGIHLLGINLQRMIGSRLEGILKKASGNPGKGLAIGAAITTLIQSGGTTIVMLIGFISAGLLSLSSAVPVMLGANIGSTVTTQLAAFRIGIYALPVLTFGFIVYSFSERRLYKNLGEALMGLSFLFLGMNFIFSGVDDLSSDVSAVRLIQLLSSSGIFSILVAAALTITLQSSSATSILVVAFAVAGIIDLNSSLLLILGVNLGASLKISLLALRGRSFSGKLATMHLLFNLFGLVVFLIFFKLFYHLIDISSNDAGRQVANAHTLYNVINALIFMPFMPLIVKLIDKYVPSGKIKKSSLFYLDKRLLYTPSVALSQVNRAVADMAKIASDMLENARLIFFEDKADLLAKVGQQECDIDEMTGSISEYTIQISQQNLSKKDSMKLYSLMHILTDIEHLSDHILTVSKLIADLKKENIVFTENAIHELTAVFGKLKMMQNLVIKSLEEDNLALAYEIIKHENKVDEIVKKAYNNHIERVRKGACTLESGRYFSELLNNLERIGDHSDNIAYAVVDSYRYKNSSSV